MSSALLNSVSAPREIALLLHGLSAQDGGAQLHVGGVGQHMVIGIDGDAARAAEGLDGEGRVRAHDFDALVFGFSVGVDVQIHRHAEQIKILRNFAGHAESSFLLPQAVDVVYFTLNSGAPVESSHWEKNQVSWSP